MCIYARYRSARFYSHKFKSERARELCWALIGDPHSLRCGDEFVNYGLGAIESLEYDFRFAKNYAEAIRLYRLLLRISGDMGVASCEARTFENIALCYENQATPTRRRGR